MTRQRSFERNKNILDAIWRLDPVGISDFRGEIPGEYQQLVSAIAARLQAGSSLDATATWLQDELDRNWGISLEKSDIEHELSPVWSV